MEVVWREGEATVRKVLGLLNDQGDKQRAYTTVLTILTRLDGLADGLFFLPVLRRLADRYADLAELDADQAAMHRTGAGPLAAALLRLSPASAVAGVAPEPVDGLLGHPPRDELPVASLTPGLLGLAAILAAVATTADVTGHAGITLNVPTLVAQGCMVAAATGTIACVAFGAVAAWRAGRIRLYSPRA